MYVSRKRPMKLVKENPLKTWGLFVLPFVVAEALTGIASFFFGILSIPPLFGVGMVVDVTIFASGLTIDGFIYKKGEKITYNEIDEYP
jgi:hypothetical protein